MSTHAQVDSPCRVLVADDSALMRRILSSSLSRGGFEVIGEAADGDEALEQWQRLRPDVMTLDLQMPGRDGIGVLRALREANTSGSGSVPVVVVSAFSSRHGVRAVDALSEGAFDLVAKPAGGSTLEAFNDELRGKLRAAASMGTASPARTLPRSATPRSALRRPGAPAARTAGTGTPRVVVIACSTGGPRALAQLVPELPTPLGAGGVVVQHMPEGFTGSLAARLDRMSPLRVVEASGDDVLDPGQLVVAAGGSHLHLGEGGRVRLGDEPPIGALRPRADLTIEGIVRLHGPRVLLVVLTGMGRDAELGARAVKAAGGRVLAEAEETCTVYGMPRAVVEAGLADVVLPLHDLPAAIAEEAWC